MRRALISRLRAFLHDTSGSYSVEAVLVIPMLVWAALATLTFVDGYRTQTMNLRVTYSIADLLSRQEDPIGPDFVDGLGRLHDYLSGNEHPTHLRVTVIRCNEHSEVAADDGCDSPDDERLLVWSDVSDGGAEPITQDTLETVIDAIPRLAFADSAILVETWLDYSPPFDVGLDARRFEHRIVVSPRFVPQLKYAAEG